MAIRNDPNAWRAALIHQRKPNVTDFPIGNRAARRRAKRKVKPDDWQDWEEQEARHSSAPDRRVEPQGGARGTGLPHKGGSRAQDGTQEDWQGERK